MQPSIAWGTGRAADMRRYNRGEGIAMAKKIFCGVVLARLALTIRRLIASAPSFGQQSGRVPAARPASWDPRAEERGNGVDYDLAQLLARAHALKLKIIAADNPAVALSDAMPRAPAGGVYRSDVATIKADARRSIRRPTTPFSPSSSTASTGRVRTHGRISKVSISGAGDQSSPKHSRTSWTSASGDRFGNSSMRPPPRR